jgi:hypothetical protein
MTLILSGTDGLSDVDGSAATPAIRGTDANTGIFFPAADTIAFSEGGTEAMRINSSGNVGIGTSSPAAPLDVNGSIVTRASGGEGGQVSFNNPDNASVGLTVDVSSADTARVFQSRNNSVMQIGQLAGTGGIVTLHTAASERMRIDSAGNVGIGVTPSAWNSLYPSIQVETASLTGINALSYFALGANAYISTSNDDTGAKYIVDGYATRFKSESGVFKWQIAASGTAGNTISFTQAMTLDSSGRLLVGTTDTTGVAGNGVKITSNSVGSTSTVALTLEGTGGDFYALKCVGVDMSLGSIASGGSPYWIFGNATKSLLLLYANGDVRMPTVYGRTVTTPRNMFIDSNGVLGGISSVRASKNNITPITDSAWLYQVSPVTFNYRKRDEDGNYLDEVESETQYGLIAEDVEAVRPEFCIYVEKDGQQVLQGVHYDRMISPLIKALQEQQAIITQLQADVAALKGTP